MPCSPCRGFTWLELLMVLAITAMLAAAAVPSLSEAIARHRLRAATTALTNSLQHARTAALDRDQGTVVCPSANGRTCSGQTDWGVGWISRDGRTGDILAIEDALDPRLTAVALGTRTQIALLHPIGGKEAEPGNQTLALCLRGKPATTVTVVVAKNGHSRVEPASADVARACAARHSRNR
jgi:prepilin-type N-terminal cleavage/methylation domain-containing protein